MSASRTRMLSVLRTVAVVAASAATPAVERCGRRRIVNAVIDGLMTTTAEGLLQEAADAELEMGSFIVMVVGGSLIVFGLCMVVDDIAHQVVSMNMKLALLRT